MNMQINWHEHYKAVRARLGKVQASPPRPKATPVVRYSKDDPCGPVRIIADTTVIPFALTGVNKFAAIRDEVLARENVTIEQFDGDQGGRRIALVRWEVWYRASKETKLSLIRIGQLSGGRCHTSIMHGVRCYEGIATGVENPIIVERRRKARERHYRLKALAAATANGR
jgi:hypothetical protein